MLDANEAKIQSNLQESINPEVAFVVTDTYLDAKIFLTNALYLYLLIITSLACLLAIIIKQYQCMRQGRLFAAKNCCANVKEVKQIDKPLGLAFIFNMVRVYKEKRYLEWWQTLAVENGYTFSYWLLGQRIYVTADPENVKTIFSSSFETFEHGPTRQAAGRPLVGNGIFVADGESWSAARALLRPSFAKSQINDLDMLDRHFQNFLHALPRDKDLVDLLEMFKWLSQDVITDMLFGSSTESLMRSNDKKAVAFFQACEYSQRVRSFQFLNICQFTVAANTFSRDKKPVSRLSTAHIL